MSLINLETIIVYIFYKASWHVKSKRHDWPSTKTRLALRILRTIIDDVILDAGHFTLLAMNWQRLAQLDPQITPNPLGGQLIRARNLDIRMAFDSNMEAIEIAREAIQHEAAEIVRSYAFAHDPHKMTTALAHITDSLYWITDYPLTWLYFRWLEILFNPNEDQNPHWRGPDWSPNQVEFHNLFKHDSLTFPAKGSRWHWATLADEAMHAAECNVEFDTRTPYTAEPLPRNYRPFLQDGEYDENFNRAAPNEWEADDEDPLASLL